MAEKTQTRIESTGRRTERVLLRIPIEVQGNQADGRPFKEKTHSLVINRNGARISMKNSPRPDDRVTITNLQTQTACPFRVVRQIPTSLGEGPEWGVECLEPEVNFWGIYFPTKGTSAAERELIDALLECSGCRFRELAQLTQEQYRALVNQVTLKRDCAECGAATDWTVSFGEAEAEEVVAPQPVQAPPPPTPAAVKERRREKRPMVKMPVRIRLENGSVEVTRTENISKAGTCVISGLEMKEGARLRITIGYAPGSYEVEVPARVVWRRSIAETKKFYYGVQLKETS